MWKYRELKFRAKQVFMFSFLKSAAVALICALAANLPMMIIPFSRAMEIRDISEAEKIYNAFINNMDFVMTIIGGILFILLLCSVFIIEPLNVGKIRYFNKAVEGEQSIKNLFYAFINGAGAYFEALKVTFMKELLVFLWSIVGFIPAAVYLFFGSNLFLFVILLAAGTLVPVFKRCQYFMVYYIFADRPNIGWRKVIKESKTMMKGRIIYVIGLNLSFIGWYFLSMMLGIIGTAFVIPYINTTFSVMYFAFKGECSDRSTEE